MREKRHFDIDRRSMKDRRRAHHLEYFLNGGPEKRRGKGRRSKVERRTDWIRVNHWYSVFPWGDDQIAKLPVEFL